MDATLGLPILVGLIAVALLFDFLNGLHDAANSIATIVSTRVLRPQYAVLWAAFFNFVAFAVFGLHVANTIGTGHLDQSVRRNANPEWDRDAERKGPAIGRWLPSTHGAGWVGGHAQYAQSMGTIGTTSRPRPVAARICPTSIRPRSTSTAPKASPMIGPQTEPRMTPSMKSPPLYEPAQHPPRETHTA